MQSFHAGEVIEVIDLEMSNIPMRGKIIEMDDHPFDTSYAKIKVQSSSIDPPEVWVNLRFARKI